MSITIIQRNHPRPVLSGQTSYIAAIERYGLANQAWIRPSRNGTLPKLLQASTTNKARSIYLFRFRLLAHVGF